MTKGDSTEDIIVALCCDATSDEQWIRASAFIAVLNQRRLDVIGHVVVIQDGDRPGDHEIFEFESPASAAAEAAAQGMDRYDQGVVEGLRAPLASSSVRVFVIHGRNGGVIHDLEIRPVAVGSC